MQPATLLLRQVNPNFLRHGHVLSIAFRPFPKDKGLLSVYDGDKIQPEPAWVHFTHMLHYASAGVWAVTVKEAGAYDLPVATMPLENFPEHAAIDFTAHDKKAHDSKAKQLAAKAEARGCLFLAPG